MLNKVSQFSMDPVKEEEGKVTTTTFFDSKQLIIIVSLCTTITTTVLSFLLQKMYCWCVDRMNRTKKRRRMEGSINLQQPFFSTTATVVVFGVVVTVGLLQKQQEEQEQQEENNIWNRFIFNIFNKFEEGPRVKTVLCLNTMMVLLITYFGIKLFKKNYLLLNFFENSGPTRCSANEGGLSTAPKTQQQQQQDDNGSGAKLNSLDFRHLLLKNNVDNHDTTEFIRPRFVHNLCATTTMSCPDKKTVGIRYGRGEEEEEAKDNHVVNKDSDVMTNCFKRSAASTQLKAPIHSDEYFCDLSKNGKLADEFDKSNKYTTGSNIINTNNNGSDNNHGQICKPAVPASPRSEEEEKDKSVGSAEPSHKLNQEFKNNLPLDFHTVGNYYNNNNNNEFNMDNNNYNNMGLSLFLLSNTMKKTIDEISKLLFVPDSTINNNNSKTLLPTKRTIKVEEKEKEECENLGVIQQLLHNSELCISKLKQGLKGFSTSCMQSAAAVSTPGEFVFQLVGGEEEEEEQNKEIIPIGFIPFKNDDDNEYYYDNDEDDDDINSIDEILYAGNIMIMNDSPNYNNNIYNNYNCQNNFNNNTFEGLEKSEYINKWRQQVPVVVTDLIIFDSKNQNLYHHEEEQQQQYCYDQKEEEEKEAWKNNDRLSLETKHHLSYGYTDLQQPTKPYYYINNNNNDQDLRNKHELIVLNDGNNSKGEQQQQETFVSNNGLSNARHFFSYENNNKVSTKYGKSNKMDNSIDSNLKTRHFYYYDNNNNEETSSQYSNSTLLQIDQTNNNNGYNSDSTVYSNDHNQLLPSLSKKDYYNNNKQQSSFNTTTNIPNSNTTNYNKNKNKTVSFINNNAEKETIEEKKKPVVVAIQNSGQSLSNRVGIFHHNYDSKIDNSSSSSLIKRAIFEKNWSGYVLNSVNNDNNNKKEEEEEEEESNFYEKISEIDDFSSDLKDQSSSNTIDEYNFTKDDSDDQRHLNMNKKKNKKRVSFSLSSSSSSVDTETLISSNYSTKQNKEGGVNKFINKETFNGKTINSDSNSDSYNSDCDKDDDDDKEEKNYYKSGLLYFKRGDNNSNVTTTDITTTTTDTTTGTTIDTTTSQIKKYLDIINEEEENKQQQLNEPTNLSLFQKYFFNNNNDNYNNNNSNPIIFMANIINNNNNLIDDNDDDNNSSIITLDPEKEKEEKDAGAGINYKRYLKSRDFF